jgi:hypothetical protein
VGKSALGRALAEALGGDFIDGDDHADPGLAWYRSSLRTSRAIVRAALSALASRPVVVIAYPVRRSGWVFYHAKFAEAGVRALFVGLSASYEEIVAVGRGRRFGATERVRIKIMIEEGYGRQDFNDRLIDVGGRPFAAVLRGLRAEVVRLLAT